MKKIVFIFLFVALLCSGSIVLGRMNIGVIGGSSSVAAGHPITDPNLISLWLFDDDATDEKGVNNLTATGTPTYSATVPSGRSGKSAVLVSASTQYFSILDASQTGLDNTDQFSAGCWVWFDIADSVDAIMSKHGECLGAGNPWAGCAGAATVYGFLFNRFEDDPSAAISSNGSDWNPGVSTNNSIPSEDTWYHMVMVYDGSYIRVYLNGDEVIHEDLPLSYSSGVYDTPAPFMIGNDALNGQLFDGQIDECFFFTDVLSEAEIENIIANGFN